MVSATDPSLATMTYLVLGVLLAKLEKSISAVPGRQIGLGVGKPPPTLGCTL